MFGLLNSLGLPPRKDPDAVGKLETTKAARSGQFYRSAIFVDGPRKGIKRLKKLSINCFPMFA